MNNPANTEVMTKLVHSIIQLAPEVEDELRALDDNVDRFENLELDSMDHVNVMTEIWESTGVEIAERDYGRLRTMAQLTKYLTSDGV